VWCMHVCKLNVLEETAGGPKKRRPLLCLEARKVDASGALCGPSVNKCKYSGGARSGSGADEFFEVIVEGKKRAIFECGKAVGAACCWILRRICITWLCVYG